MDRRAVGDRGDDRVGGVPERDVTRADERLEARVRQPVAEERRVQPSPGSTRSLSPHSTVTGTSTVSTSSRPGGVPISRQKRQNTGVRAKPSISVSASPGVRRSPATIWSRIARCRKRGRRHSSGASGRIACAPRCELANSALMRRASRSSRSVVAPPGEIAVTVIARPRLASSNASQPPSEKPAMCADSQPASSSIASIPSTTTSIESPSGSGGPPVWPPIVGASTSKSAASRGTTGPQTCQVAV